MAGHIAPRRRGFTLIELIVVVTLMLFLAGLAALFIPSATSSAREANAAVLVQGWLNMAKQKALRDQAPRGLRLWNKNNDLQIYECEFIELPDPFSAEPVITAPASLSSVIFQGLAIANGYPASPNQWLVQPGDYISINQGQMHRITNLAVNAGTIVATLNSPMVAALPSPTSNYYILRSPRPVGDETLQMPMDDTTLGSMRGIIIDLNTNSNDVSVNPKPNRAGPKAPLAALPFTDVATGLPWNFVNVPLAAPFLDILFNPSGSAQVFVGNGGGGGGSTPIPVQLSGVANAPPKQILCLWIRTVDIAANPYNGYLDSQLTAANLPGVAGDPTILAVHLTSGFIGAYAPTPAAPGNDPYTYVE